MSDKVRVYEIAEETGASSADVLKKARDLGLDLKYEVQDDLFNTKNSWFKAKVFMTTEPDFFDSPVSSYASDDEQIDLDNFEF